MPDHVPCVFCFIVPTKYEFTFLLFTQRHVKRENILIQQLLLHHSIKQRGTVYGVCVCHGRISKSTNAIECIVQDILLGHQAESLILDDYLIVNNSVWAHPWHANSDIIFSEETL